MKTTWNDFCSWNVHLQIPQVHAVISWKTFGTVLIVWEAMVALHVSLWSVTQLDQGCYDLFKQEADTYTHTRQPWSSWYKEPPEMQFFVQILRQILAGLAHLHSQGIIHSRSYHDNKLASTLTSVSCQISVSPCTRLTNASDLCVLFLLIWGWRLLVVLAIIDSLRARAINKSKSIALLKNDDLCTHFGIINNVASIMTYSPVLSRIRPTDKMAFGSLFSYYIPDDLMPFSSIDLFVSWYKLGCQCTIVAIKHMTALRSWPSCTTHTFVKDTTLKMDILQCTTSDQTWTQMLSLWSSAFEWFGRRSEAGEHLSEQSRHLEARRFWLGQVSTSHWRHCQFR